MKKDICDWLRDYLKEHGRAACKDVKNAAKAAGYTKGEIKEAKLLCRVKSESVIYWSLPEEDV